MDKSLSRSSSTSSLSFKRPADEGPDDWRTPKRYAAHGRQSKFACPIQNKFQDIAGRNVKHTENKATQTEHGQSEGNERQEKKDDAIKYIPEIEKSVANGNSAEPLRQHYLWRYKHRGVKNNNITQTFKVLVHGFNLKLALKQPTRLSTTINMKNASITIVTVEVIRHMRYKVIRQVPNFPSSQRQGRIISKEYTTNL
ncbi:unnamed protein product [Leptidea sinapis]|uniref:Uncharacterized protein n=1 Tax=Leptidea sinapis TaxID=189913 RepID=A0A5E4QM29_9NEOP|nr:unnamed protein product [Leptidea sinapis]